MSPRPSAWDIKQLDSGVARMTSQVMADHVRHLQERLRTVELERDVLHEALRPFAWEHTHAWIAPRAAFARAATLVPATSPPPSVPSAAAPETT